MGNLFIHLLPALFVASVHDTAGVLRVSRSQLLEVVNALLNGRPPNIPNYSVCLECKRRGTVCVMVAQGTPCLGPVTQAGCNALCPSYARGCFGCFGPNDRPNTTSLTRAWVRAGASGPQIERVFQTFNAGAGQFQTAAAEADILAAEAPA